MQEEDGLDQRRSGTLSPATGGFLSTSIKATVRVFATSEILRISKHCIAFCQPFLPGQKRILLSSILPVSARGRVEVISITIRSIKNPSSSSPPPSLEDLSSRPCSDTRKRIGSPATSIKSRASYTVKSLPFASIVLAFPPPPPHASVASSFAFFGREWEGRTDGRKNAADVAADEQKTPIPHLQ